MIKAIFFDLDGVIVDSERIHHEKHAEYLKEIHSALPPERLYYLIGSHKSQNPWPKIVEGINLNESLEEFVTKFRVAHQKKMADIRLSDYVFSDMYSLLAKLSEMGLKLAVASSSNIKYIHQILQGANIEHYFDLIVTGDDFAESKPAPDIYLYCMKYFELVADECLVVEDSPIGIEAGKRAGMRVIARADHIFHLDQSGADERLDDLNGLVSIVNQINQK